MTSIIKEYFKGEQLKVTGEINKGRPPSQDL